MAITSQEIFNAFEMRPSMEQERMAPRELVQFLQRQAGIKGPVNTLVHDGNEARLQQFRDEAAPLLRERAEQGFLHPESYAFIAENFTAFVRGLRHNKQKIKAGQYASKINVSHLPLLALLNGNLKGSTPEQLYTCIDAICEDLETTPQQLIAQGKGEGKTEDAQQSPSARPPSKTEQRAERYRQIIIETLGIKNPEVWAEFTTENMLGTLLNNSGYVGSIGKIIASHHGISVLLRSTDANSLVTLCNTIKPLLDRKAEEGYLRSSDFTLDETQCALLCVAVSELRESRSMLQPRMDKEADLNKRDTLYYESRGIRRISLERFYRLTEAYCRFFSVETPNDLIAAAERATPRRSDIRTAMRAWMEFLNLTNRAVFVDNGIYSSESTVSVFLNAGDRSPFPSERINDLPGILNQKFKNLHADETHLKKPLTDVDDLVKRGLALGALDKKALRAGILSLAWKSKEPITGTALSETSGVGWGLISLMVNHADRAESVRLFYYHKLGAALGYEDLFQLERIGKLALEHPEWEKEAGTYHRGGRSYTHTRPLPPKKAGGAWVTAVLSRMVEEKRFSDGNTTGIVK